MGLRFDPMGGGQFNQLIKQVVEAERQPIKQLEQRKSREEAKLKLFQEFKGKFGGVDKALEDLSSFKKFREFKVDLGEGASAVSVTVDKDKAAPGTYQMQIEQLAARTSVISNGFADPDEPSLGLGFIVMKLANGDSKEIFVDADQASLRGVAAKVNADNELPVRASVVKDSSDEEAPWKLIISAKKEGAENNIVFPEFYFLDGEQDFFLDDTNEARNARILMDGFPIEVESNSIADFLPGVNLNLKQAKPGQPFTLNISEDHQKVAGKVKELVNQLNTVLQFINKQNAIDEKTDTRNTFAGDTGLQTVEYRLRNMLHEGFAAWDQNNEEYRLIHLNQIGVEFDKTGSITFKEDKFTKALEKDFDGISQAITGDMGLAFQMREIMRGYTRPGDGMLSLREQGLRSRIADIDRQIEAKSRVVERKQQQMTDQFSRLQSSLSNMQKQQQYLSATMGGGGGDIIGQLMGSAR